MTTSIRRVVATGAALAAATPLFAHIDEHVKFNASDGQAGDLFGHAVAIHEDLIAVGAPAHDSLGADAGAVYVFERAGLEFEEEAKLLAFDGAASDLFGDAVAVSHHTLAVGAPKDDDLGADSGAVYVFVETAGVWSLEAKLLPSDGAAGDEFGASVDVEGDLILVGAPRRDQTGVGFDAGAVYVFERSGTVWTEEIQLLASDAAGRKLFGSSVAIGGEDGHAENADRRVIVGAPQDSDVVPFGGSAYVFAETAGVWTEEVKLTDANAGESDLFGSAVDLLGSMAIVGSPRDDDFVVDGGAIFAFEEDLGVWTQTQHKYGVAPSNPTRLLGSCVAVSHAVVLAGAPLDEVLAEQDAGLTFVWTPEEDWEGDVAAASDPEQEDHLAGAVAANGCWMVSGADRDDDLGVDSGSVYVFPAHHHHETYCTAGTSASGCQASLGATGIPSASAPNGFVLFATGVEGQKDGLFYFSTNGQQAAPWYGSSSFQCVVPPVIRTSVITGTGSVGECDGLAVLDMNAWWWSKPTKNPGGNAVIYTQFWYRDPLNPSGTTTSLSNAIVTEICP